MWTELFAFIGIPVIRNIAGWVENSFKDKKIDKYEWQQLGATILRVGVLGVATWFGLNGIGINTPAIAAGGLAVGADFLLNSFRKREVKQNE